MLSHPATLLLQPPDPFPDLLDTGVSPRPRESLGESGEPLLEAPAEALDNAPFLVSPLLGTAVETHFPPVVGDLLVQL